MSTFAHTRWDTSYFLHRTFYTRCRKAQECASPASVAAVGPHLEFSPDCHTLISAIATYFANCFSSTSLLLLAGSERPHP